MKEYWKKYWKVWIGLFGLVVVLVWAGGGLRKKIGAAPRTAIRPSIPSPAALFTARVEMVASRVDIVGTVASERKVNLSARIPAHIAEVFVTAGDVVKKGQLLVTLDDREIREQALASEAQLRQAETEYERARQLFEKNATTEQALTAAESAYHAARARVDQMHVMLSYAQVASPLDGIVTERRVEPGDLAAPGMVLLSVYDPEHMRLEAPVPLRLVERLALNQTVEVTLDRPACTVTGRVTEIVSEVDPSTRTQLVKVHLEGLAGQVLPGTFGRLWVLDEPRPIIRVPKNAVRTAGQLEMVEVLTNGQLERRLVKTGPRWGDEVEILSGLSDGEVVVVNPNKEM